ncbi:MAG: hypothetical protein HGN29_10315 [Asgard group archaeon]|nr:hypothetical protein [Asgard group archaeon]
MNIEATLMFDENRKQRIARIIELAIPMDFFDLLEDLTIHYGSQEIAIFESLKSHHKEKFGILGKAKVEFSTTTTRVLRQLPQMDTPVTDGKLSKIFENRQKFDEKTQTKIEEVDKILEKFSEQFSDLTAIKEIRDEITSMKSLIQNMGTVGNVVFRTSGVRADLSSLEVDIADSEDGIIAPPERPLLENVLDSMLLFDDEELDEIVKEESAEQEKTAKKKNK